MQIYLPPTPLASISSLPLARAIRLWNALELEAGEVELLEGGGGADWLKQYGPRLITRSRRSLEEEFPSYPYDVHETL